jgi:hypothetical protein
MKLTEIVKHRLNEDTSVGKKEHQISLISDDDNFVRDIDEKKEEKIVEILQSNCKEIISVYKKANPDPNKKPKVLFRGESSNVDFFKNSIRAKREPLFLSPTIHNATIEASNNLGLEANRENAIFCAVKEVADAWGSSLYIIFPVDGYGSTWFKKKFFVRFQKTYMFDIFDGADINFAADIAEKKYPFHHKFDSIDQQKYNDEYDSIRKKLNDSKPSEIKDQFIKHIEDITKEYKPINGHLEDALTTSHVKEYLISGKTYYGLRYDLMTTALFKKILNV